MQRHFQVQQELARPDDVADDVLKAEDVVKKSFEEFVEKRLKATVTHPQPPPLSG